MSKKSNNEIIEKENDIYESLNEDSSESHEKVEEIDNKEKNEDKAYFLQRLVAYFLDFLIVACISSLFSTPFVDADKSRELSNQSTEIVQKYVEKKIDIETYSTEAMDVSYKIARNNGILSIITIVVGILYFVVFQIYNDGRTLGKKLMKIKVVSENGDLTMNQMIFRALIANFILVDIISFAFLTFSTKQVYFYCSAMFGLIQYIIVLVSALMVMYRKDGCAIHDKLAHTKVIRNS